MGTTFHGGRYNLLVFSESVGTLMAEISLMIFQMMVKMTQSLLNRLRLVSPHCAAVERDELP